MMKTLTHPVQVFGFCGFIGSGKNAAANELLTLTNGKELSFAGPLKDAVAKIFGWERHMIEGATPASREWRETKDAYWSDVLRRDVTPRMILQEVGTNVFREYHSSIWLAAAARQHTPPIPSIFTDCRFGNEMHWVTTQQGMNIWVYRPDSFPFDETTNADIQARVQRRDGLTNMNIDVPDLHLSEYAFLSEGAQFIHVVVENTGSLEDLRAVLSSVYQMSQAPDYHGIPWRERTVYVRTESTVTTEKTVLWQWRNPDGRIAGVLEAPRWLVNDEEVYGHGV